MKELQRHLDAFELYFQLKQDGEDTQEAVMSVACQQGVSDRTVYRWKDKLHWDDREAVRGLEIQKRVEERTNSSVVDNKVKYLSIVNGSIDSYDDDVKAGKRLPVQISSPRDLDVVVKLALLLQGESTDRTEQNGQIKHEMSVYDRIREYEKRFKAAREDIDSGDGV